MTPRVSVLIPTYNRDEYLAECLDSILEQSLRPYEVIVVDDGSSDATRQVLNNYESGIKIIKSPNRGKPAALNLGLAAATGKYVWVFDDDDVALLDALERFVAPLEAHPEYGFSYSTFHYTETEPGSHRIGRIVGESRIPDVESRGFLIPLLESNFLGGAALFARRACYDEVGGFDERLLRSQDYEMAIRIARRFTGVRVPGPATFHYRQHPGQRGPSSDQFEASQRYSKWLEYDQLIFRRLYEQLPLEAYLPPGGQLTELTRNAHLQRLAIVASKLLVDQACQELEHLGNFETTRFSDEERRLIRRLTVAPFYKQGRVLDRPEFTGRLRALARRSPAVRQLRREIVRSIGWRPRSWKPRALIGQLTRSSNSALRLFLPIPRLKQSPRPCSPKSSFRHKARSRGSAARRFPPVSAPE